MSLNRSATAVDCPPGMESALINAGQRIKYIDIARGLGIILVVLGHNPFILKPNSHIFYTIFSFHMPLFFFLSGLVYKNQNDYFFSIKKRAKGLLIPYFSTLIFWMFVLILKSHIAGEQFHIGAYIKTSLYSTGPRLSWEDLWFLTSLFITQAFFQLIDSAILQRIKYFLFRFSFMVFLLLIGIFMMREMWLSNPLFLSSIGFFNDGIPGLPWSLDLILIAGFYFYLGAEAKNGLHKSINSNILFIISFFSFAGLNFFLDYHLDLNLRIYDNSIINSLEAIFGIFLIIYLSKKIDLINFKFCGSVFAYLGRLSLVIFIFHEKFQYSAYRLLSTFDGVPLEAICVYSFLLGLLGPIFLYETLIKRISILKTCYPVK